MTFDDGWRASIDGAPVPAYATGTCQLGVELPAGEHALLLAYRQRLLPAGAAITLVALLGWAAALAALGRRVLSFAKPA
jgi:hypothetical protein